MLVDARKSYAKTIVVMQVAAADNRDVFRYLQPRIQDRVHRANSERIVVAEYAVGSRVALQQQTHRLRAPFGTLSIDIHSADHIVVFVRHASVLATFFFPIQPPNPAPVLSPTDVR